LCEPFYSVGVEPREVPGVDPCLQQQRNFLERIDNLRRRVGGRFAAEPIGMIRPVWTSGWVSSQGCWSVVKSGVSRRHVSSCACWRAVAISRSSRVRPGRTMCSRRSLSQASWSSNIGLSCSKARSPNHVCKA
jgi:hypothetical protein